MVPNISKVVYAAVLSACFASSAMAAGLDTKRMSCEALKQECLARVEQAKIYASENNSTPDPNFSDLVICYRASDEASKTGRWPKVGPMLFRSCLVSGG